MHQYRYGTNHRVHDLAAYAKSLHSHPATEFTCPPRLIDKGVEIIEAGADMQPLYVGFALAFEKRHLKIRPLQIPDFIAFTQGG